MWPRRFRFSLLNFARLSSVNLCAARRRFRTDSNSARSFLVRPTAVSRRVRTSSSRIPSLPTARIISARRAEGRDRRLWCKVREFEMVMSSVERSTLCNYLIRLTRGVKIRPYRERHYRLYFSSIWCPLPNMPRAATASTLMHGYRPLLSIESRDVALCPQRASETRLI